MAIAASSAGINVPITIGIALGSAFLLFAITGAIIILLVRRRHKRALTGIEQNTSTRPANTIEHDSKGIPRSPLALRRSLHSPVSKRSGWAMLYSREDLREQHPVMHEPMPKHAKRKSMKESAEAVSWPLPRNNKKKRSFRLKKLKTSHLSAIIESPKSQTKTPHLSSNAEESDAVTGPSALKVMKGKLPSDISAETGPACNESPKEDISPSAALRPKPLFSPRESCILQAGESGLSSTGRSCSVPSVLISSADHAGLGRTLSCKSSRPLTHVRSTSLGSIKSGAVPSSAPPPLPMEAALLRGNGIPKSSGERSPSRCSISSTGSDGSSILRMAASPNMKAVTEFSKRHPEMRLGAHIREGGADIGLKNSLIAGPRPVRTNIRTTSHTPSSHGSVRENSSSELSITSGQERNSAVSTVTAIESNPNRLSVPQVKTAESIRYSRISSVSDQMEGTIKVLSTPNRNSQLRKVSVHGSPAERKRSSVLRDVSGNMSLLPRDISQTSTHASSNRSSTSNPFSWDSTSTTSTAKPSAMKGSPGAKKAHRRQNCVRIVINPTILGPPSRSTSSSKMGEIAEECFEGELESNIVKHGPIGLKSQHSASSVRPPSSSDFEPDLRVRPTSLRASLTHSSPTLSLAQYYPDQQPLNRNHQTEALSDPLSRVRDSASSFIFSFPTVPSQYQSELNQPMIHRSTKHEAEKTTPQSTLQRSREPYQPPIPGLTLLGRTPQQDLSSHNMNLHPSPPPPSEEYDPNSPALAYPTPPDKATAQESSTRSQIPSLHSSLSPARKSSPTIQLSTATTSSTTPVLTKPTPLSSSVNPFNTKPDFFPPMHKASPIPGMQLHNGRPSASHHLNGPRAAPPMPLLSSVQALRRMDSEALVDNSRETGRYRRIGREASPNLGGYSGSSAVFFDDVDLGEEKENRDLNRRGGVWEAEEDFWTRGRGVADEGFPIREAKEASYTLLTPLRAGSSKRHALREMDVRESIVSNTPGSLYDADGFLKPS